jgi:hypothetical protein
MPAKRQAHDLSTIAADTGNDAEEVHEALKSGAISDPKSKRG